MAWLDLSSEVAEIFSVLVVPDLAALVTETTSNERRRRRRLGVPRGPRPEDLTGRTFGELTAIHRAERKGHAYWRCRCSCGEYTTVNSGNLRTGLVRSCGHLKKAAAQARVVEMPAGSRWGRLTVIRRAESSHAGKARYRVECDCGEIRTVDGRDLRNGNTRSCGCGRRRRAA